jgi:hypothetical protein
MPPIIDAPEIPKTLIKNKIIVYPPFEDQNGALALLAPFITDFSFHVNALVVVESTFVPIVINPLSRDTLQIDLYDCADIIINAGVQLGKKFCLILKLITRRLVNAKKKCH